MATAENILKSPESFKKTKKKINNKKKWVLFIIIALAAGGLSWEYIYSKDILDLNKISKNKVLENVQPIFHQLDPFTVNLKPDGQFLQATFTLQISSNDELNKIKMYTPQIRSRLLLMLSNKTVEEISTLEGKKILSSQIAALVEEPYQPGLEQTKIENVFFTTFVIQ